MSNAALDYARMKEAILESADLDALKNTMPEMMPPVPMLEEGKKFIVISYSSRDYKSVYCDLLEFHQIGLRFWYDNGIRGATQWEAVVKAQIDSPDCAGVLFYLSQNLMLSPNVGREIEYTFARKRYAIISTTPDPFSKIFYTINSTGNYEDLQKSGFYGRIGLLSSVFSDEVHRSAAKDSPMDTKHIKAALGEIADYLGVEAEGFPFAASAQVRQLEKELYIAKNFVIEDGVLLKYKGRENRVEIPPEVTQIGSKAFDGCGQITALILPEGLRRIGQAAFRSLERLEQIRLPDSLEAIDEAAFEGCTGLSGLVLPEGLTRIGSRMCFGCAGLREIAIPESVTAIGKEAFSGCTGLTRMDLPRGVTEIGSAAFDGCAGLTQFAIPEGVTEIAPALFRGCSALEQVPISDSVKHIGCEAFKGCRSLRAVHIPNGVTGDFYCEMFMGARRGGRRYPGISEAAFEDCAALTEITIPGSTPQIGSCAFRGCTGLTALTIPSRVTSIGSWAFAGCAGLTSITVPASSVSGLSGTVFANCAGLESLEVAPKDPRYRSSGNCIIKDDLCGGEEVVAGCKSSSIPADGSISSICSFAFAYRQGLTAITIPGSIQTIENHAFRDCPDLTDITYEGTLAAWQEIDKGLSWSTGTHCTIHCTDGDTKK